jgi:hypothetical protein
MLAVDEPLTLGTNEASRKIEPKVVQADLLDNVAVFYLVERQSKHTPCRAVEGTESNTKDGR